MNPDQSRSNLGFLPIIFVTVFVSTGLSIFQPWRIAKQALTVRYASYPGCVNKLVVARNEIERIEYSFTVNGRRYFGERATYSKLEGLDEIERAIGGLKQGGQVTVYANPGRLADCVLVSGLTYSSQFGLAWSLLSILGLIASLLQYSRYNRSDDDIKRGYQDCVECEVGIKRRRLIPGGFKSPVSVAATCFGISGVLFYVLLEIGDQALDWWDLGMLIKVHTSITLATFVAAFDYFYTLRGNQLVAGT